MKKAQLLSIFLDNFDKGLSVPATTTSGSAVRLEPPLSCVAPLRSPQPPSSRWSVAANLNSIAMRARQIHQRAGSLQGNVYFDKSMNRSRHVVDGTFNQQKFCRRSSTDPDGEPRGICIREPAGSGDGLACSAIVESIHNCCVH